uniref:Ribosomal protein S4 n=1 Tax=Malawimonas californiana TaxID=221722 RepID=A0A0B5GSD7_MALCL|nr:ribosomal protein S4 [Malawimonas californiana]AJF22865.1 ribosomal protein S4 [Malawimonas californiana]
MTKRLIQKFRISRQIGEDLWGTFKKINYKQRSGQHGKKRVSIKEKNYIFQEDKKFKIKNLSKKLILLKLRKYYINISKKQFNSFSKKLNSKESLTQLLEKRIDTIIYRLNFASSFMEARQLINHGHVLINGRSITKTSYITNIGDKIEIIKNYYPLLKKSIIKRIKKKSIHINCPNYLEVNYNVFCAVLVKQPEIDSIPYPTIKNNEFINNYKF